MSEYVSNIHGVDFTSVFFVKCVDVFVCLLGCVRHGWPLRCVMIRCETDSHICCRLSIEDLQKAAPNLVKAVKNEVLSRNSSTNSTPLIPQRRATRSGLHPWISHIGSGSCQFKPSSGFENALQKLWKRAPGALGKIRHLHSPPLSSADCCNYMCKWVIGKVLCAVRCE